MTIQIYDLCGKDDALRFSPYCWRTKMAMHHKGLAYEGLPWRFTEKERLAKSGQERVPVLVDGETIVHDSWAIALYLDKSYADRPALMVDATARAYGRFINTWADTALVAALAPIAIKAVHDVIDGPDAEYFRSSREARFGKSLEEFGGPHVQEGARAELAKVLRPVEAVLAEHPFLGGQSANYADYIVAGTLMWSHVVSPEPYLEQDGKTAQWFERMLDLHDGAGRKAPTVRS